MREFTKEKFESGNVRFVIKNKPVSIQNTGKKKSGFKAELQKITEKSDYVVTSTCWVAIDYYCHHIKRMKNPGVYDMDNIIKPILDGLSGTEGIIIDDVVVDRVTVNWVDTDLDDYIEVEIQYPDLLFSEKKSLIFLKSSSGWCFPSSDKYLQMEEYMKLVRMYFYNWEAISTENDYLGILGTLPNQQFLYFSKIKDKGYRFFEL